MMQLQCFFQMSLQFSLHISKFYLPHLEVHNGQNWMQVQTFFGRSVFFYWIFPVVRCHFLCAGVDCTNRPTGFTAFHT
jgi:hypothetical protein